MTYELKKGETVSDLLDYAGGLSATAYGDKVTIDRTVNGNKSIATVSSTDFDTSRLDDGDVVVVGKALDRYENRVDIEGAIMRPGHYALDASNATLRSLVRAADGLREDAFLDRAQIIRETEDLTPEIISVDLRGIMNGSKPDVKLKKNDQVVISSSRALKPEGDVIIAGEVHTPGNYAYGDKMTIEDLVMLAGGLNEGASTVKVDISRRVDDPTSTSVGTTISKNYELTIKDGYVVDGNQGFVLKPNDIVDIRRSPGYVVQRRVEITGEVVFEGAYTLEKRSERLSDLVRRAGGLTQYAYIKGAHLERKMTVEEITSRNEVMQLALRSSGNDSISIEKLDLRDIRSVGIDLAQALAHPGSAADLVLQEGDHLVVPEMVSTVRISGEVLYPNMVVYSPKMKLKDYINQAGGYGDNAAKKKAFVVYLNGTVSKGSNSVIEPGCNIIIPSKSNKKGMSLAEWLAIGTSAASLGTMAASIYNIIK